MGGTSSMPGMDDTTTTPIHNTSDETGGIGDINTTAVPDLADIIAEHLPGTSISDEIQS